MKKLLSLILLFTLTACTLGERRPKQTEPSTEEMPSIATTAALNMPISTPTDATTSKGAKTRTAKLSATNTPGPNQTSQTTVRRPVGIYAHVDLSNFIKDQKKTNHSITAAQMDTQLNGLYQGLLANPAIAGLTVGAHWDLINPNSISSSQPYDWSYLDDAFNQVSMWNTKNPTQALKTVQLIVEAGFDTPSWVLDQLPSCDGLFHSPPENVANNCGKATFLGYAEAAEGTVLPLPWNPIYKSAFKTFLMALAARYESNPAFVSIDVSGPTAASTEMFLPDDANSTNPQTQFGTPISPDAMWQKLLALQYPNQPAYQNSDQAFIDEWNAAIDMYGQIFSGVTLVTIPAAGGANGGGFPVFSQNYPPPPAADKLFSGGDCSQPDMSCAAVTIILTHFIDPSVGGANGKATQTSGLKANNTKANLGVSAVKLLSGMTASLPPLSQVLGGEQYDHAFSTDASYEGCLTKQCTNISPEQAEYNVLKAFFDGTPAAASFGGTPGSAPLNYLQDNYEDILYATMHVHAPAQVVKADGTSSMMTAQDLLNLASQKLLQIAETNHTP
jgi:hypothetical protein